jgi:A/G-specific adenine glycosylase
VKKKLQKYITDNIIEWGKENKDNFPWRNPENLYQSIIAEIMLIRTPPEQVLSVYNEFIESFSDFEKLNKASYNNINKYIKKLGLYWRTDLLIDLANYIVNELDGEIKPDLNELIKIPGLGEYTASAVLIYYFKKRAVPIDSNTVRFVNRYFDKSLKRRHNKLKNIYDNLVPNTDNRSTLFNESFLDFMRKICAVTDPRCNSCPINQKCKYYNN